MSESLNREKVINQLLLCEAALAECEQLNVHHGGYIQLLQTGWRETKQHLRDLETNTNRVSHMLLGKNKELIKTKSNFKYELTL